MLSEINSSASFGLQLCMEYSLEIWLYEINGSEKSDKAKKNSPVSDYSKSVLFCFVFLLEKRQVKKHTESVLNTIISSVTKYGLVSSGATVFTFPEKALSLFFMVPMPMSLALPCLRGCYRWHSMIHIP